MSTTTTARPHPPTTRASRATHSTHPTHPGGAATSSSAAFLAEVRVQWALATRALGDAVAHGDDVGQQEAGDRLAELCELLQRQDLSPDVLRTATL